MKNMILTFGLLALTLSGCAAIEKMAKPKAPAVSVRPVAAPAMGVGMSAAALDSSTAAQKAAALAAPSGGDAVLGKVVVGLGSPAEQGFWLKSALVVAPGKGRVATEGGASVAVDLLPAEGAALLSLAAYRALGLALTDLPEVTVYGK